MTNRIPYSLQSSNHTSDRYYRDIAAFAERWSAYTRETVAEVVNDFRAFRQSEGMAERSFEACALELLALGVLLREHGRQAMNLPGWSAWLLAKLVILQGKWPGAERAIKTGRGLITGALPDTVDQQQGTSAGAGHDCPDDRLPPEPRAVAALIRWLRAHGETAQAERFTAWLDYLTTIGREQARTTIRQSLALADNFAVESEPVLGRYTTGVEPYRAEVACQTRFRYDAELLTRSRLEYHLGLLGTEILNRVYRDRFEATEQKLVIVPPCLRTPPQGMDCQAEQTSLGAMCRACHPACRVNQLSRLGQQQGFLVCCIPDDELAKVCLASGQAGRSSLGVVGLSCALTNWSAGWEAERLGLAAQGHLLDYPGCRHHWHPQGIPTDTNLRQLRTLLGQTARLPADG
jgi:hypothetical protein